MQFVPPMLIALKVLAVFMVIGGTWAFIQSPSGTQFPIPIAVGGFVLFVMLTR